MAGVPDSQPSELSTEVPGQDASAAFGKAMAQVKAPASVAAAVPAAAGPSEADLAALDAQFSKPQASGPSEADLDALDREHGASNGVERYGKPLLRGALASLPILGGMAGGIAGMGAGLVTGVAGAGLGYGTGKALQNMGLNAMGEGPQNMQQAFTEPIQGVAEGMAQELGGQAIHKILGVAASRVSDLISRGMSSAAAEAEVAPQALKAIDTTAIESKSQAEQVQAATTKTMLPEKGAAMQIQDAQKLMDAAEQSGFSLRPDEVFPNDPKLQAYAAKAMASPKVQQASLARAAVVRDAVENIANSFRPEGQTAADAVKVADVAERASGQLIGQYRQKLLDSGVSEIPAENVKEALPALQDAFGFTAAPKGEAFQMGINNGPKYQRPVQTNVYGQVPQRGQVPEFQQPNSGNMMAFDRPKTNPPDAETLDAIATRFQMNPGAAKLLVKDIENVTDAINNNGTLKTADVDRMYKVLKRMADAHAPSYPEYSELFNHIVNLKDALRDDFSTAIGQSLGGSEKTAYDANMARYSDVLTMQKGLRQLLKPDSVASQDVARYLTTGGLGNADRIANFGKLVHSENPAAWEAVGEQVYNQMMQKYQLPEGASGQRLGEYNWQGLNKFLGKGSKGYDQMVSIIGQERADSLANMSKAMSAVQAVDKPFEKPHTIMGALRAVSDLKLGTGVSELADMVANSRSTRMLLDPATNGKLIQKLSQPKQDLLRDAYALGMSKLQRMSELPPQAAGGLAGLAAQAQQRQGQ